MQVGEVLEVVVETVAPFGLFVDADGMSGLILIPELSWQRVSDPAEIANVGDRVQCKVLHFPPKHRATDEPRFIGSIRELTPELNPWRDPSVFMAGTEFTGVVEQKMSYGVFVEHPRGASALLHASAYDPDSVELNIGDSVDVVIVMCDVEGKRISIRLADGSVVGDRNDRSPTNIVATFFQTLSEPAIPPWETIAQGLSVGSQHVIQIARILDTPIRVAGLVQYGDQQLPCYIDGTHFPKADLESLVGTTFLTNVVSQHPDDKRIVFEPQ